MKTFFGALILLLVVASISFDTCAQTAPISPAVGDPAITPNGAIGEVRLIEAGAKQIILKTDAGSLVTVNLNDQTVYMRLAPGEKTLTNATKITLSEVGEGDRVWARGKVSDDRKSVPASALIVMSKADLAKKHEEERAEWRRRGILGVITAVKPETSEITISSRSMMGMQSVVIPVTDGVEMRRYAPDSIKFGDAKQSIFTELRIGDQLRALGERSADGSRFTAEKIVTGSFRTVAGTVTAVDAQTGVIRINDLQTKQPLTIVIKEDAILRRFPPLGAMGGMMMDRGQGAQGESTGAAEQDRSRPSEGRPSAEGGGGPRRMGRGAGFNFQDMVERLPVISAADIVVGDTIIVSSTKGNDPDRLTAISLVAGADTLLNAFAQRQAQQGGEATMANPAAAWGSGIQLGIGLP